ncbi:hypothetical protein PARMER_00031 [Parabacteroides merdae ATCC 43184]|nr:hypothetical protein PARMER_00031 [Parabacteroides merdae ATCC 43184]
MEYGLTHTSFINDFITKNEYLMDLNCTCVLTITATPISPRQTNGAVNVSI